MVRGILFGLAISLIHLARGYIFFLKSETYNGGICYSNETERTITFIQRLDRGRKNVLPENSGVNYTYISKQKKNIADDCSMFHGCNYWTTSGFQNYSISYTSNEYIFPPVLDRRWNDLKDIRIKNNYKTKLLLPLTLNSSGVLHISILAHDSAQIVFTQHNGDFDSNYDGYMAVLGGWIVKNVATLKNYSKSVIRYCPNITSGNYPQEYNIITSKTHTKRLLKNGREWLHVSLEYTVNQSNFSLRVQANGEEILSAATNNTHKSQDQPWRIGVRKDYGYADYYKLHDYKMLKPTSRDVTMHTTIELQEKSEICLDVTYYYRNGSSNEPILVQIQPLDTQNGRYNNYRNFSLPKNFDFRWAKQRIETDPLDAGKYNVSIFIGLKDTFIGDVHFCTNSPFYATTKNTDVIDCKFLDGNETSSVSSVDNGLSFDESLPLCKYLGSKSCTGVEYCIGEKCGCISGFQRTNGTCTQRCSGGHYGVNCSNYSHAKCENGSYYVHTGACIDGCEAGYRSPECTQKLLVFRTIAPTVTNVRAYSAIIDLSRAIEGQESLIKMNHSSIAHHHQLKIQLENLTATTNYSVRAIIVEKDGQNTTANTAETSFTTLQCTLRDVTNSKMTVNDDLELNINILNNTTEHDFCSWNSVSINCSSNASFNISKEDISRGKSTKISNSMDDISCIITLYDNIGKEISTMLYVRKLAPCDLIPFLITLNLLATVLINIATVFLFTRKVKTSNIFNKGQQSVVYRRANQAVFI